MADGSVSTLSNPVTGTGTTNFIPKFTGSTTLGNSLVYDNGTNVGIGTTSPSYKLDVNGTGRFTSNVTINSDDTGVIVDVASRHGLMKYYLYSTGLVGANTGTDNNISTWLGRFSGSITSPTQVFQDLVVMNSGNVGIGTTSPGSKLEIVGDNNVLSAVSKTGDTSLPTKNIASLTGVYNNGSNGHQLYINSTAELGPWEFNMTKTWGGFLTFGVSGDGTARTRALYVNGNGYVGVNVNPVSGDRFEVAGSVRIHTGNNWDAIQIYSDGANGYIQGLGDETGLRIRSEYGNILLADNRGKVGIGIASPTALFHVANSGRMLGVLRIQGTNRTSFYDDTFAVNNDGGGADGFIYGSNVGGSFPFDGYGEVIIQANPRTGYSNGISLVTGTTSPSIKVRVTEAGNVGIGTSTPQVK
jgi:hypothetical protein